METNNQRALCQQLWAENKYLVLSHSSNIYKDIRQYLKKEVVEVSQVQEMIDRACQIPEHRGQVCNAFQHIWGYFKKQASLDESRDYMLLLDRYRFGQASKQDLIAKTRDLLERYPNTYLQHSTLLKGDSHETLKSVFAKYKDITKHSNDVETVEVKSLLKTLSEEPCQTAVTSLGLTPMLQSVTSAQEEYDQVESQARAHKSAKEVGKTKQVRTELTSIYDLFMRYTVASVEAYPEKEHLTKLFKDLNTIRDSKRRLTGSSKKKVKAEETTQVAG